MDSRSSFDYRAIDDVIHSRIRLAIMAILASVEDAAFTHLRDEVRVTDGNLSSHMSRLTDAGYVELFREIVDGRAVTRYRLTGPGRAAFGDYIDRIERLLGGIET